MRIKEELRWWSKESECALDCVAFVVIIVFLQQNNGMNPHQIGAPNRSVWHRKGRLNGPSSKLSTYSKSIKIPFGHITIHHFSLFRKSNTLTHAQHSHTTDRLTHSPQQFLITLTFYLTFELTSFARFTKNFLKTL